MQHLKEMAELTKRFNADMQEVNFNAQTVRSLTPGPFKTT